MALQTDLPTVQYRRANSPRPSARCAGSTMGRYSPTSTTVTSSSAPAIESCGLSNVTTYSCRRVRAKCSRSGAGACTSTSRRKSRLLRARGLADRSAIGFEQQADRVGQVVGHGRDRDATGDPRAQARREHRVDDRHDALRGCAVEVFDRLDVDVVRGLPRGGRGSRSRTDPMTSRGLRRGARATVDVGTRARNG